MSSPPTRRWPPGSTVSRWICSRGTARPGPTGELALADIRALGLGDGRAPDGRVQHGLSGGPRRAAELRRQPAARRGQPRGFSSRCTRAGRSRRCRSITSPTACTCRRWDSAAADAIWTEACGKERWRHEPEDMGERIETIDGRGALGVARRGPRGAGARRARAARRPSERTRPSARGRGGRRDGARSQRSHPRLRAPLHRLQAPRPAVVRSRAAWRVCCATRRARRSSCSPARRTRTMRPASA